MNRLRVALGLVGLAMFGFGINALLPIGGVPLRSLVMWLVGAVVAHDAILAPATVALALIARLALPPSIRRPVVLGLVVLAEVTITAIPVLGGWGRHADSPTVLDRNYVAGWGVFAALVVAATVGWVLVGRRRRAL